MLLMIEIFGCAKNHGKILPKLFQTSFSGTIQFVSEQDCFDLLVKGIIPATQWNTFSSSHRNESVSAMFRFIILHLCIIGCFF